MQTFGTKRMNDRAHESHGCRIKRVEALVSSPAGRSLAGHDARIASSCRSRSAAAPPTHHHTHLSQLLRPKRAKRATEVE